MSGTIGQERGVGLQVGPRFGRKHHGSTSRIQETSSVGKNKDGREGPRTEGVTGTKRTGV